MTTDQDRGEIAADRAAMLEDTGREPLVEVAEVADVVAGGVPTRVLRPAGAAGTILYLHGGGFVFGTRDTHDRIARRLAATTGQVVVLPEYRLAPEAPFPAAYDDALAVTDWVTQSGLPGPRVALGDSAGANLALGAALARPGLFDALVLVYPFLDPSGDSHARDLADAAEQAEEYAWYWRHYLAPGQETDERADPLRASSYASLPRTLVQLAGLDVLTPTGRGVAERIRGDGVDCRLSEYPDVPHAFWRRAEHPESQAALEEIAAFLRDRTGEQS